MDQINATELLPVRTALERTGIPRSTLYRMIANGRIPAVRQGRRIYFREDQLAPISRLSQPTDPLPPDPSASAAPSPTPSQLAQAAQQFAAFRKPVTLSGGQRDLLPRWRIY